MVRFLMLLMVVVGTLSAFDFGSIEGRGGVIYWSKGGDGIRYANATLGAQGSGAATFPQYVEPIFSYGLEGSVRYTVPDKHLYVELDGTVFDSSSRAKVSVPVGGSLVGIFDPSPPTPLSQAFARYKLAYKQAGATAGLRVTGVCSSLAVHLMGGVRFARLHFTEEMTYVPLVGTNLDVVQLHSFTGIGPRLGASMRWNPFARRILKGLGVEAHLAVSGLMGHNTLRLISPSGNVGSIFVVSGSQTFPKRFLVVPCLDFRIGGVFDLQIDPFHVGIECGYALNTYFDGDQRVIATATQTPDADKMNAGFGGPYLALRARY